MNELEILASFVKLNEALFRNREFKSLKESFEKFSLDGSKLIKPKDINVENLKSTDSDMKICIIGNICLWKSIACENKSRGYNLILALQMNLIDTG